MNVDLMHLRTSVAIPAFVVTFAMAPEVQAGYFAHAEASAYVCAQQDCAPILSAWPTNQSQGRFFFAQPWLPASTEAQANNGGIFESFDLGSQAAADLASGTLRAEAHIGNAESTQIRT